MLFYNKIDKKNNLRNKISDPSLNNCLITQIEKYVMDSINNDAITHYFQVMKTCGEHYS